MAAVLHAVRDRGAPRWLSRVYVDAIVVGLAVTGVLLRVWIFSSDVGALDADEAVPGTMARHVLDGEFTAFYWGQSYGGTQEVLLSAIAFAFAGSSVEALRAVTILLFAVGALLTWRIGIRTVGEPNARLGAGVFWVWSPYVVWKSTRAHGYYGAAIVLSLAVVLLALRLEHKPTRRDLLLLGLALGLGWWATPQVVVIALPTIAWLVWRRSELLRDAWLPLVGVVAGSLPWLVSNLRHDWWSLHAPPPGGSAIDRIHNLVSSTLPTALGARLPFTLDWVGGDLLGPCLYGAMLAAIAWALVRRRIQLGPLVPVLVAFPVFYAVLPYTWLTVEPRYLVVLGPALALVLVAAGTTPRRGAAIACALAVLSAAGVALLDRRHVSAVATGGGVPVPTDFDRLLNTLERHRVRHAFADYWIAWRVVFESDERIIAVPAKVPGCVIHGVRSIRGEQGRYPPFYEEVTADPRAAYVFAVGGSREPRLRPRLLASGYRPLRTGDFVVYLPA